MAYRDATLQLNLFHPGRQTNADCVDDRCKQVKETTSHIMWDCAHTQAAWNTVFEKWTKREQTVETRHSMLESIASRTPPMTWGSIRARVTEQAGLATAETKQALQTVWRILFAAVPAAL